MRTGNRHLQGCGETPGAEDGVPRARRTAAAGDGSPGSKPGHPDATPGKDGRNPAPPLSGGARGGRPGRGGGGRSPMPEKRLGGRMGVRPLPEGRGAGRKSRSLRLVRCV
ncbi:hypothetical protein B5G41_04510 [Alistipes onderdonkii]|uniref:Uncharacterized protein n=1 Tax=Alistipes onderdonkii TaxID=328813 RepID=A0A1Y3QY28_9BACT|nr:hypothetical protein B5G41_04510 [Alistipes onderdonkii]